MRFVTKLAILMVIAAPHMIAQWSSNPLTNNPICLEPRNQRVVRIISDMKGGAIMTWEDERPASVMLRGTKTEGSRDREVPQTGAMKHLLHRMKRRRQKAGRPLTGRAFLIQGCREALATACRRVGVPPLTHHGLRHFFATTCIESGVDIPTVSRWLGHADGGALAMRVYGHLRQEHSQAAAAKVRFGGGL